MSCSVSYLELIQINAHTMAAKVAGDPKASLIYRNLHYLHACHHFDCYNFHIPPVAYCRQ